VIRKLAGEVLASSTWWLAWKLLNEISFFSSHVFDERTDDVEERGIEGKLGKLWNVNRAECGVDSDHPKGHPA